ncbi:MAG: hypothetical protein R2705_16155 [Ilumatobacteraceae bacterium]
MRSPTATSPDSSSTPTPRSCGDTRNAQLTTFVSSLMVLDAVDARA